MYIHFQSPQGLARPLFRSYRPLLAFVLPLVSALHAEEKTPAEAMAASLELQRASIRKQVAATSRAGSFFVLPWREPCDPIPDSELDPLIREAARANDLKPELIRAVIRQESASRPCAVSPKGALGLMQLMPATAGELGVRDPFDPKENVLAGARYLRQLLTRFNGDLRTALGAYNAGPNSIPKEGGLPGIPETRAYVEAILAEQKSSGTDKPQ